MTSDEANRDETGPDDDDGSSDGRGKHRRRRPSRRDGAAGVSGRKLFVYQLAFLVTFLGLAGTWWYFGTQGSDGPARSPFSKRLDRLPRPVLKQGDWLVGPVLAERGAPASPYRRDYEFTADWFTEHIPIWQQALASYAGRPNVQYLEIGVWEGRSAIWMLENVLTHPSSGMVAVDLWGAGDAQVARQRWLANVERSGAADRVTTIQGFSQVELRKLALDRFDIIYIDGSHRAADTLEDAVLCWRLLKPGGVVIFDDYRWQAYLPISERPQKAIEDFYWYYRTAIETIHVEYQVIFRKKPPAP